MFVMFYLSYVYNIYTSPIVSFLANIFLLPWDFKVILCLCHYDGVFMLIWDNLRLQEMIWIILFSQLYVSYFTTHCTRKIRLSRYCLHIYVKNRDFSFYDFAIKISVVNLQKQTYIINICTYMFIRHGHEFHFIAL